MCSRPAKNLLHWAQLAFSSGRVRFPRSDRTPQTTAMGLSGTPHPLSTLADIGSSIWAPRITGLRIRPAALVGRSVRKEWREGQMPEANVHDRLTIERIYPRDAFDRDTRMNAETKTEVLHGLRITSSPDANGVFSLARTSRHVAEQNPEGDVVFVSPHRYQSDDALMQGPDYGGPEEKGAASRRSEDAQRGLRRVHQQGDRGCEISGFQISDRLP